MLVHVVTPVESSEWDIIKHLPSEEFARIGQILVEVHLTFSGGYDTNVVALIGFFDRLEEHGFRLFYKEPNVHCGICVEYALINKNWDPLWSFQGQ